MRRILFAAAFLSVAMIPDVVPNAQNQPNLDRRIEALLIPDPLPVCAFEAEIARLARASGVLLGFQRLPICRLPNVAASTSHTGRSEDLSGLTVREALNRLTMLVAGYRWEEREGIAVVRPSEAWGDSADPLNFQVSPFNVANVRINEVIQTALGFPASNRAESGRLIDRRIFVSFHGGTLLDALNSAIRNHQAAGWSAGVAYPSRSKPAVFSVTLIAFDRSSSFIAAPLARLQPRP